MFIKIFDFNCLDLSVHRRIGIYSNTGNIHCVKSARIWSYSGPYFPAFGLNTERYFVSLRIRSKCGKIRTRITPNTDTSYALIVTQSSTSILCTRLNMQHNLLSHLELLWQTKFSRTNKIKIVEDKLRMPLKAFKRCEVIRRYFYVYATSSFYLNTNFSWSIFEYFVPFVIKLLISETARDQTDSLKSK